MKFNWRKFKWQKVVEIKLSLSQEHQRKQGRVVRLALYSVQPLEMVVRKSIGVKESNIFRILMFQLNPTIPVITPKGNGWAFFCIDRSQEHDLEWVVFLDSNGECWTFRNSDIRIQKNYTFGRNTG
jgi:hypothetical protein